MIEKGLQAEITMIAIATFFFFSLTLLPSEAFIHSFIHFFSAAQHITSHHISIMYFSHATPYFPSPMQSINYPPASRIHQHHSPTYREPALRPRRTPRPPNHNAATPNVVGSVRAFPYLPRVSECSRLFQIAIAFSQVFPYFSFRIRGLGPDEGTRDETVQVSLPPPGDYGWCFCFRSLPDTCSWAGPSVDYAFPPDR